MEVGDRDCAALSNRSCDLGIRLELQETLSEEYPIKIQVDLQSSIVQGRRVLVEGNVLCITNTFNRGNVNTTAPQTPQGTTTAEKSST